MTVRVQPGVVGTKIESNHFYFGGVGVSDLGDQTVVTGNTFEDHQHGAVFKSGGSELLFCDNEVFQCGGGVDAWASTTVCHNHIHDNVISSDFGASDRGGGVKIVDVSAHCIVEGNLLEGNTTIGAIVSEFESKGGGIYIRECADVSITDNVVCGNHAIEGAGVYVEASNVQLSGNVIVANSDTLDTYPLRGRGGGIASVGSVVMMVGNTIAGNTSAYDGAVVFDGGTAWLDRCIIAHNVSGGSSLWSGSSQVVVECCDVWNPGVVEYGGELSDLTGISGNISEDPLFCEPAAYWYGLEGGSPCAEEYNDCGTIGALGVECDPSAIGGPAGEPDARLQVFPNPAPGDLSLALSVSVDLEDLRVDAFSAGGRRIRIGVSREGSPGRLRIVVPGEYDAGVYFLRVMTTDWVATRKVILVR